MPDELVIPHQPASEEEHAVGKRYKLCPKGCDKKTFGVCVECRHSVGPAGLQKVVTITCDECRSLLMPDDYIYLFDIYKLNYLRLFLLL